MLTMPIDAQVDDVVLLSDVINGDDVGVIQPSGGLGFLLESLDQFVAVRSIVINRDGFQCNGASDEFVVGFVDGSHGAASQFFLDLVAADSLEACPARLPEMSIG